LLHAVSSTWPPLEWGLSLVGSGALVAVRAIALWSAEQRALAFVLGMPDAWQCSVIVAAFVAFPRLSPCVMAVGSWASAWCGRGAPKAGISRLRLLALPGILVLIVALLLLGSSTWYRGHEAKRRLAVTALDVDQGDALVIDFPDGRLGLVDGGGFATGAPDTGARVVLPYLRSRGRRAVDLMVLSHAHPDHLLGLVTVAEALPVRELWLVEPERGGGDVARLVQAVKRAHGRVRSAAELCPERAAQDVRQFGGAAVTVFVPCNAASAWVDSGENDRSLVVRIQHGARAVLLTGDIERQGEARLVQIWSHALRADLLKAPHHGSDTSSSPELLAAVRPTFSLISCGVRNRFEHPRPSVLERLGQAGVRTLRTDRSGSISWLTDGRHTWLRGFVAEPPSTSVGARERAPSPAAAVAAL
jgi:competence protein ComEC